MENASKALIMAAEILIGILLLSLGVYLFSTYSQTSKEIHQNVEQQRLEQFNAQYTAYLDREDLTIYDIRTIVNNIKSNNKYYEENEDDKYKITASLKLNITITGLSTNYNKTLQNLDDSQFDKIVKYDQEHLAIDTNGNRVLPQYKCTAVGTNPNNNNRVNSIVFERK